MSTTISAKVIKGSVLGLSALGLLAIFMFAYVMVFFVRDLRGYYIVGDQNVSSEVGENERESRPFVEVNIFKNTNDNGYFFEEVRFNYFEGLRLDENMKRSSGLQWIHRTNQRAYWALDTWGRSPWESTRSRYFGATTNWTPRLEVLNDHGSLVGLRAVTEDNNIASGDHRFTRAGTEMTVAIDGQPHRLNICNENGHRQTGRFTMGFGTQQRYHFSWDGVFQSIANRARHIVTTDGTYQRGGTVYRRMQMWDLFNVRPIVNYEVLSNTANVVNVSVQVRITVNTNGFRNARQSLFGMVGGRGDFDLAGNNDYNTDFATYRTHVRLTEHNFDRRFSQLHGGYLLSLSTRTRVQLLDMRRFYLTVDLGRTNGVVGVDFNGLRSLDIHTLRISGNGNFYLLEHALQDSMVRNLEVSHQINLIKTNNSEVLNG